MAVRPRVLLWKAVKCSQHRYAICRRHASRCLPRNNLSADLRCLLWRSMTERRSRQPCRSRRLFLSTASSQSLRSPTDRDFEIFRTIMNNRDGCVITDPTLLQSYNTDWTVRFSPSLASFLAAFPNLLTDALHNITLSVRIEILFQNANDSRIVQP